MNTHTWGVPEVYQVWPQDQANQNDRPKKIWKKCPISDSNHQECVTPSETAHAAIHMYCTLFLSNKHFVCFTTFHHYGTYFTQSWRARGLTLSTGLMAMIWCSHCNDLASTSSWKPMLCFKPLQSKVAQDQHYYKSASLLLSSPQLIIPCM